MLQCARCSRGVERRTERTATEDITSATYGRAVSSNHGLAAAAAAPAERVALCDGDPVSLDARRSRSVRREAPRTAAPAPRIARRSSAAQRVGGYARLPSRFPTL
jgi:hypothetical protein